jgi:serine/threonine protein kinase
MPWPRLDEYNQAIQNPRICFEDPELRTGTPEVDKLGLPRPRSGNFATVYRLDCAARKWAVKCFSRQTKDQEERYTAINSYLSQASLPYTVGFSYLVKGIRVNGQWYPVVKMEWTDGVPLNTWVEANLRNPAALVGFLKSFTQMLSSLQRASIAHGDLQHGNILVVNSSPKLVDYDGMYVPALNGRASSEVGLPNYQSPKRTPRDFGPYIDNFSAWVIAVSLLALTVDPKLWQTFKGGVDDCLLFRKADFEHPERSGLLKALDAEQSPELRQMVTLFKTVLTCSPQSVPALDGTFSFGSAGSSVAPQVPDWVKSQLPTPKPIAPAQSGDISWLIDATSPAGPPVSFADDSGRVRLLACVSLIIAALVVVLSLRGFVPLWSIALAPAICGFDLLVFRKNYSADPSVQKLHSVRAQRTELKERIHAMEDRLKEGDHEKDRINLKLEESKAALAKEDRELQKAQQGMVNANDSKLQAAISASLKERQKLDSQEASELSALQRGLGKTVAGLSQSLASLAQAEQNELANMLQAVQATFVQIALKKAWIRTATLPGIGPAYRSRLQASGIVTAADIDYRIHNVKGIGSQRAQTLEGWRRYVETNARTQMPRTLSLLDQNNITAKYAAQKSSLQAQLHQQQASLHAQESAIKTKYAGLRSPVDAVLASEQQKHQIELARINAEFKQKRDALANKAKELEQSAVREIVKVDGQQNSVRKDMFALQWRVGKVDRELAQFSRVSFGSYVKRVILFS